MTMQPLEIIPAGAGSGKTHTIQEKLSQLVDAQLVSPDRIAAVTFTEAAASELRERIRSGLVSKGRLEDALRLDQSYISTIHGFGLRIITEFALDAGVSPNPRLLNDDEKSTLVRLALARSGKADYIKSNLKELGYSDRYDVTPEELFRDRILLLIDKLRSIGREEGDPALVSHVRGMIGKLYGPTRAADHLKKDLVAAVRTLLEHFPDNLSLKIMDNKTATEALNADYWSLKRACGSEALDSDWKLWQRLRNLRTKAQKHKLPDGYADLAEAVMAAASGLPQHPGPLEQALLHVQRLVEAGQECLGNYAEDKQERGLVDYADMLGVCHRLLTSGPDILASLRNRIDCLVVDEFQDTNPLQFSLLWTLTLAGVPTLIVGDAKQAIMGFQGADVRLLQGLQGKHPDSAHPLTNNWRSTPAIMAWVNRVGKGLFGTEYQELSVKDEARYSSSLSPLEVIEFPDGTKKGSNLIVAQHTAVRIKDLLDDSAQMVYDKHLKKQRHIRGGDIAVICPVNKRLKLYADSLRALGIATRVEQDGWFESRIIQIAWQALSFVADPRDRHAETYLAVTELGSLDLEEALARQLKGDPLNEGLITSLKSVADNAADKPVDALVAGTIAALDLFGKIADWPDAAQARANLLRLSGEAAEFMSVNRDALACAGIYGDGLNTFLPWLKSRAERENGQPDPAVIDENSVQVMTWHKSKGLEWPVVAVCATDCDASPRLPAFEVEYLEGFSNLDTILESARIEIYPDFVAPETKQAVMDELQDDAIRNARRLLYVALTRAREKVILECPTHLDKKKERQKTSYWDVLRDAARLEIVANTMVIDGEEFGCRIVKADKEMPVEFEESALPVPMIFSVIGRRAIVPSAMPSELNPEAITPSSLHGLAMELPTAIRTEAYGPPLESSLGGLDAFARGTLLHRCFEVLSASPERVRLLNEAVGYPLEEGQTMAISRAVAAFNAWLTCELEPIAVIAEVPLLALNDEGTVVSGTMDLLAETADGFWIIDHKSDLTDLLEERFNLYLPQLRCYAQALAKVRNDKPVKGLIINWISYGIVSVLKIG
jgi:ATP-dependent exoDNAse (exonuclease V) beta subunit